VISPSVRRPLLGSFERQDRRRSSLLPRKVMLRLATSKRGGLPTDLRVRRGDRLRARPHPRPGDLHALWDEEPRRAPSRAERCARSSDRTSSRVPHRAADHGPARPAWPAVVATGAVGAAKRPAAIAIAIALVSDTCWAIAASSVRTWFARSPRRVDVVGAAGGASIIGVGVSVALTGRRRVTRWLTGAASPVTSCARTRARLAW
jgi:hypothetical protein